jgi:hypothetical protein
MNDDLTTVDKILEYVEDKVEHKIPFSPGAYLDLAQKMTSLMGNLDDELIQAKMKVNRRMAELCKEESVAKAKMVIQAEPEYEVYLRLDAKRKQAEEFIRLAKKRVELQSFDQ